ncbi:hypothetical protein HHI36_002631 [Cryptolaemus montrouzieri]|uniref:Peptidase S1 domain-containing protein n=1 Tax=Cryptolaemus montrouzieri TaxID=559131 RepID=A0ABD2PB38_9CUCU
MMLMICRNCILLILVCSVLHIDETQGSQYYTSSKRAAFCPPNTECQPLTSCPILNNALNNECVLRNRIDNLSCGYQGSGLVCCPNIPLNQDRSYNDRSYNPGKTVDGVKCGLPQVLGENYNGIGAYPWVARIGFKNVLTGEVKFPCAGSIINNRVILTAAHCALAKADNYKLFSVRIGEYSTNTEIDCGPEFCGLPVQDVTLSHVVVHPGYDKQTFKDNVALIVLRNSINYTVTAQPICLPESWSVTNNNGVLVGWGKSAGQTEAPAQQQVLHLPIISINRCYTVYGKTLPVTDDQLCAGGEFGKDACSGFGGAPLLVQHGEIFYQVGILSFGSDQCGAGGVPSVYTNVKKYVDWIKENTPVIYNN